MAPWAWGSVASGTEVSHNMQLLAAPGQWAFNKDGDDSLVLAGLAFLAFLLRSRVVVPSSCVGSRSDRLERSLSLPLLWIEKAALHSLRLLLIHQADIQHLSQHRFCIDSTAF